MSAEQPDRHIVVAIDDSLHSLAALEAAAELAAGLDAELVGVFEEDVDMLHCAALPFAATLDRYVRRPLSAAQMERAMRAEAGRLRGAFERVAARHGARARFRCVRGRVAVELLAASEGAEMLVLGKAGTSSVRRVCIGGNARVVLERAKRTVVLLQHGARITRPVLVVCDGTAGGDRALAAAVRLAREDHGRLAVVVPSSANQAELRARVLESAAENRLTVRFVDLPVAGVAGLARAARAAGCETLVLNADSRLLENVSPADLAFELDCPVVVVR
jgi:nucleotide-binding universal stress UspA family protein